MNQVIVKETQLQKTDTYSPEQIDLIKRTVAKNATDDELKLFFYRCKEMNLNPLLPGQVYFLKFGNSPGTIIIGIEGFRIRAHRTGQLSGIKRGVIRNDKGECIGAWADVYRKDWNFPVHEEVPLNEYYDDRKQLWKSMPETMIKKVCEVAALRMAFPEDLGGLYIQEEMDQAVKDNYTTTSIENEKVILSGSINRSKPSDAQLKRLYAISMKYQVSHETVKKYILDQFKKNSSKELSISEYSMLCDALDAGELNEKIVKDDKSDQELNSQFDDTFNSFDNESLT